MRRKRFASKTVALLLVGFLAACAVTPPSAPAPGPVAGPQEEAAPPVGPVVQPDPEPTSSPPFLPVRADFAALRGWAAEDHLAGLRAWAAACEATRTAPETCADARAFLASPGADRHGARAFLEARFTPEGGAETGLLTAYFAPEYAARSAPDAEFSAPLLPQPADIVRTTGPDGRALYRQRLPDGRLGAYPDRTAIETSADDASAMAWMRPEDLFFLQIQGSGYLTFENGSTARAAYAADNGHGFVGIARPMADQGLLPRDGTSGEAIRGWLAARRGPEADRVMRLNPRYIFFRLEPDDGRGPGGAAGVPLIDRRAIAVDPAHWRYGELVWIEADGANLIGARDSYRGLVTALDTGNAIRGAVRADFYMGRGDAAGEEAGTVRHPLRMWRLVPRQ